MYRSCRTLLCIFCLEFLFLGECRGLSDVKINVPIAVIRGKDAILQCSFDLEGENLYSVKWYRGGYEFFRYTPKETEPIKIFHQKGIKVNLKESTDTKVVLKNVSRDLSGPFSVEVTVEMPSFFTAVQTATLHVVDIPKNSPHITGLRKRYTLDDEVFQANCTSMDSYPAANMTWYINGLQVRGPQVSQNTINNGKFLTVISMIRHRLTRDILIHPRMKLRCSASIYNVYHQSTEMNVELIGKRRKKHHKHEVMPTTAAPIVYDYTENIYEDSIEAPPKTTLWFWPTLQNSSASTSGTEVLSTISTLFMLTFLR